LRFYFFCTNFFFPIQKNFFHYIAVSTSLVLMQIVTFKFHVFIFSRIIIITRIHVNFVSQIPCFIFSGPLFFVF
jgi:hypothetical protein